MKNVLVLMPVEARHKEKIEAAGKDCHIVYSTPAQVTEEMIRSANVIFGNPKAEMIGASRIWSGCSWNPPEPTPISSPAS